MLRARTYESDKAIAMYEAKKIKRYRSAFTTDQINYLEKQFYKCPYIGSATRKEVANILNISERAVKIWFQNRRMKEKKEANSKECNIDRHNNLTRNIEFAKDSLNNVHSSQSANDRQCSLQPTLEKHVDTTKYTNYCEYAMFPKRRVDLRKETVDNRKSFNHMVSNTKDDVEETYMSEPVDTMKYNLKKTYNNKSFVSYLESNKKNVSKGKMMPEATKPGHFRDPKLNKSSTQPKHPDLPEDLSRRNLSNGMTSQRHQGNVHLNSAYIPFCNAQDVCLSAGNLLWKPVSVIPALSTNAIPVTVPNRQASKNRIDDQKCKCNCNCQSRNRLNYDQRNTEVQPQYVIAIPYNNNINILR